MGKNDKRLYHLSYLHDVIMLAQIPYLLFMMALIVYGEENSLLLKIFSVAFVSVVTVIISFVLFLSRGQSSKFRSFLVDSDKFKKISAEFNKEMDLLKATEHGTPEWVAIEQKCKMLLEKERELLDKMQDRDH